MLRLSTCAALPVVFLWLHVSDPCTAQTTTVVTCGTSSLTNGDGTQVRRNSVYDSISGSVVFAENGTIETLEWTASGARNSGGYGQMHFWLLNATGATVFTGAPQGFTQTTYGPLSLNITSLALHATAGMQLQMYWTTLANFRFFDVLAMPALGPSGLWFRATLRSCRAIAGTTAVGTTSTGTTSTGTTSTGTTSTGTTSTGTTSTGTTSTGTTSTGTTSTGTTSTGTTSTGTTSTGTTSTGTTSTGTTSTGTTSTGTTSARETAGDPVASIRADDTALPPATLGVAVGVPVGVVFVVIAVAVACLLVRHRRRQTSSQTSRHSRAADSEGAVAIEMN